VRPEYRKREPKRGNLGFSFGSGLSSRKKEWCSTQIFHIRFAALHTKHSRFLFIRLPMSETMQKGKAFLTSSITQNGLSNHL
jgi:hypothetical protein